MARPSTPLIAVDIIIELGYRTAPRIVLVERRYRPYGWALPGGFVNRGETLEHAAVREAAEETGLAVDLKLLLGCYSDPRRDARGHTVSAVYIGETHGRPRAGDDAAQVIEVDPRVDLPPLAFDHAMILRDYQCFRETGVIAPLRG